MKRGTFITAKLITTCQTYRAILSADRFYYHFIISRPWRESRVSRSRAESLLSLPLFYNCIIRRLILKILRMTYANVGRMEFTLPALLVSYRNVIGDLPTVFVEWKSWGLLSSFISNVLLWTMSWLGIMLRHKSTDKYTLLSRTWSGLEPFRVFDIIELTNLRRRSVRIPRQRANNYFRP